MKGGERRMNKKTVLTVIAVTVLGASAFGATSAFANDNTSANDGVNTLVQKIATKFGLKQSDVQAVFDEARTERQKEMEKKYEDQLNTYVSEGKITDAQKNLILAKHAEMKTQREANRDDFRNLTQTERKNLMETRKTELENWAKENGIDLQYLMPFGKGKGPGPHGAL